MTNQLNVPAEMSSILFKYLQNHSKAQAHDRLQEHNNADKVAEAALLSLIEQVGNTVIGDDERLEHPNDMDNVLAAAQNALKATQRQTLHALLKGEKE